MASHSDLDLRRPKVQAPETHVLRARLDPGGPDATAARSDFAGDRPDRRGFPRRPGGVPGMATPAGELNAAVGTFNYADADTR
jgi:hypothetical protein